MVSFFDPQTYIKGLKTGKSVLENIRNFTATQPQGGILGKIRGIQTQTLIITGAVSLPRVDSTPKLGTIAPKIAIYGQGKTPIEKISGIIKQKKFKWVPPKELDLT